jgi:integrase
MARRSRNTRRDEAIVRFLLDTGARTCELGGLSMEELD